MSANTYCLALAALAAFSIPAGRSVAQEKPPSKPDQGERGKTVVKSELPVERLAELNAKDLFGDGKVSLVGEKLEVLLDADGQVASTFDGKGLIDTTHPVMKGSNRKFIQYGDQKDGEQLLPGLAAVGLDRGYWMTRFPLAGETKLTFDIRFPNLLTSAAVFKILINWDGSTGYEIRSFNSISILAGGRPRGGSHLAENRNHREHMAKWFPRKGEPVPVEIGIADGTLSVKVEGKEIVSAPAVDKGGRVGFVFDNVVFTLQNLKISGKLDPEWCEERLAAFEKQGRLIEEAGTAVTGGEPGP